jgi:hypothetical protein
MPVNRHKIDLGKITLHVRDATSIGGRIEVQFSDNAIPFLLLPETFDITPPSLLLAERSQETEEARD